MEQNKQAAKVKLESMLGAVERKIPATAPAIGSCLSRAYCV